MSRHVFDVAAHWHTVEAGTQLTRSAEFFRTLRVCVNGATQWKQFYVCGVHVRCRVLAFCIICAPAFSVWVWVSTSLLMVSFLSSVDRSMYLPLLNV